jgi:hypothetical protein
MMMEVSFNPDVFHGELTANRGQIFVRVPRSPDVDGCTLAGFVHGPRCEYAHTLPAKFVLRDLGPGPTLLARATITDPCLWTSDLPQIYDVHVELRRGAELLASEKRTIGLRGLGTRTTGDGHRLVREGKVWVPRGVGIRALADPELHALREQLLVGLYQGLPPLDLLQTASQRGLYLIVELPTEHLTIAPTLQQLARWPAVMLVILPDSTGHGPELRQVAPNLLLGERVLQTELAAFRPAAWSQAVVVRTSGDDSTRAALCSARNLPLPVLLQSATDLAIDLQRSRAACDLLQAATAPYGQFAGYLAAVS